MDEPVVFTRVELALLRREAGMVADCIAHPDLGIEYMARGTRSHGGPGFQSECTKTALIGAWHEFLVDRRYDDGTPYSYRQGRLLAEAKVTYTRLKRWCEALPADVREQARIWAQHCPVDTSDGPKLYTLTLAQLADPEPVGQLDLFDYAAKESSNA